MCAFFRNSKTLIALALIIIVPSFLSPPEQAQEADSDEPVPTHIVAETNPDARVRRAGWSAFSNLSLGASVQFGDLIDPGSQPVEILCADLSEQVVTQLDAVPCPQERSILVQNNQAMAGWQRGAPEDIMTPFLVSPRATLVATAHPVIQWNPVMGARGYRVTVRGEDVNWTVEVSDPDSHELIYPDDAPPLMSDVSYSVEIDVVMSAGNGRSSAEEDATASSFVVLAPAELESIQSTIAQIHSSIDNERVLAFVDARYYAQNRLFVDAADALLPIAGDFLTLDCSSETPIVYLMLGDLYLEMQLERYAALAFTCANELAAASNDLESQALSATALAYLAPNEEERTKYVTTALDSWETLGADTQVSALLEEFMPDQ